MKKYDIAVIGGGFAGVAAAIAAAREGLKVILIEKGNCLGGAATNALVTPFVPFWTKINNEKVMLNRGIFEEIIKELEKLHSSDGYDTTKFNNMQYFNEEFLKIVLNRMVIKSGAELLFHSFLTGVKKHKDKITSVSLATRNGIIEISADYFVDATGDALLAHMADFKVRLGRDEDNLCQPMTLCFRVGNVDSREYHKNSAAYANKLYNEFQSQGKIKNLRENILTFNTTDDNIIHFNSTRIVKRNPVDPFDITKAEIEAREQVIELFKFMKENIPVFKDAVLLMTASEIGVRESRMIEGEYLLTVDDIKALRKFEDSIALGNYAIDIHSPDGRGTTMMFFKDGEYYSIPYRALIPKNSLNLLVAGRCISVDHEAQSSMRVMPIVCSIGEAAGVAAAIAAKQKVGVKEVNISLLRDILKQNGAVTEL